MKKNQLERIMGHLSTIEAIINEDTQGSREIKDKLEALQGEVANELKNTVWQEYLDREAAKQPQT